MIFVYIGALVVFLLGAWLVLSPLRGSPRPFPSNPRPEELRVELEALKQEAKRQSGPERVRLLKRIAWIERELGNLARSEEARAESPRRFPLAGVLAVLAVGLLVGAALVRYTIPRLPGGAVTESLAFGEASRLKELREKAESSGSVEDWLAYADYAFNLGDLERALEGYDQVIKLDHTNLKAFRRIGMILFMAGRPQEAAEILAVVTQVDPDPEGLLFLGNAYFQLGEYREAIAAWEEYLNRGGEARDQVQGLIEAARARLEAKDPGELVYAEKCAACHGAKGEGGIGPKLAGSKLLQVPGAVEEIVRNGRGTMPAIPLADEEMSALLDYLRRL